uniref:Uncharacterized protein n=1 Tax=Gossypium raimondii TaxID=29730 RepID=A0A0D2V4K9_GOSRA|nr:hypothetical protein B456_012G101200 [Gossypium raimondii]
MFFFYYHRFCLSFYLHSHNSQIHSQLESLNTGKSLRCKTEGTLSLRTVLATKTITFESLTISPEQDLLSFLLYAISKLILANGLFGGFQLSFPSRLADLTLTSIIVFEKPGLHSYCAFWTNNHIC